MGLSESQVHFRAELSSLSTAIEEINERITKIADSLAGQKQDAVAHDLYQAERSLVAALRSIAKVAQA